MLYFLNFMIKLNMTLVVYAYTLLLLILLMFALLFLCLVMGCTSVVFFVLQYGLLPKPLALMMTQKKNYY